MSTAFRDFAGTVEGTWSTPVQIDGNSVIMEYSVDGISNWHSTFTTGDLFARVKIGLNGTWSTAYRIVGETGPAGPAGPKGDTGATGAQGLPGYVYQYRDTDANKSLYAPPDGAQFFATDTKKIYVRYNNSWSFAGTSAIGNLTGTASASQLPTITASMIAADIAVLNQIWTGAITGKTFQTAASGSRAVLNSSGLSLYGSIVTLYDPQGGIAGVLGAPNAGLVSIGSSNCTCQFTTIASFSQQVQAPSFYAPATGGFNTQGYVVAGGYVMASVYKSADSTSGVSQEVTIGDVTLKFKNGIFVGTV
jgi:hypothetical protein